MSKSLAPAGEGVKLALGLPGRSIRSVEWDGAGAVRPEPTVTFVPVFQTGNAAFALAKSLLQNAGIYFHDAGYGLLDAFAGPSVLEVPEMEAERARQLLRELDADLAGS